MKLCKRCGEEKPLTKFNRNSTRPDGYLEICCACRKLRDTEYASAVSLEEKACKKCGVTKLAGQFHVDSRCIGGFGHTCKECTSAHFRTPEFRDKMKADRRTKRRWIFVALSGVRYRCKKKNIPYNLTYDDIVVPEYCPVLGIPLILCAGAMNKNSPTIDKLVPRLGYVKGNVKVISWLANKIKSDQTDTEVFEKVAAYMRSNANNSEWEDF